MPQTEASKGNTPGPQLPHERDQSARGQQAQPPQPVGEQALRDLEQGRRDSDRGPVLDEAYRRQQDGGDRRGAGDEDDRMAKDGEYTGGVRRSG